MKKCKREEKTESKFEKKLTTFVTFGKTVVTLMKPLELSASSHLKRQKSFNQHFLYIED